MLLSSGLSPQMIRTRLDSGQLIRVRRGVFVAADAWPEDAAGQHVMRARAELVLYPAAVLSHRTAALVWGLPHPDLVPSFTTSPRFQQGTSLATTRVTP